MRWLAPKAREGRKPGATIYFHYPCFDGLVSATITAEFLETALGFKVTAFREVNYDRASKWLTTRLPKNTAVVDFLYHPQAMFWADHHATTFLNEQCREDFRNRASDGLLIYDAASPSCASVLWSKLESELAGHPRYADMVFWADRIDSAKYSSVEEALFGSHPAEVINLSLADAAGREYRDLLLRSLRTSTLEETASLRPVRARATAVRKRIEKGLRRMRESVALAPGEIVVFDAKEMNNETISRYSPYFFYPQARYSVGLVRSSGGPKITAMRNPWLEFDSVPLGQIFAEYGGGGHQRVASLLLPHKSPINPAEILSRIIEEIRMADERKNKVDRDAIA